MSGTYAAAATAYCQPRSANGLSAGRESPCIVRRKNVVTVAHVHSAVRTVAPSAAGTTATRTGTRRPRNPGVHLGNTSPQRAMSPMARNASNSEKTDNTTTYSSSGNQFGSVPLTSAPGGGSFTNGTWKVNVTIRQMLLGKTVNGIAYAAIRAHRGTPSTGSCARRHAVRTRPDETAVVVIVMHRASQRTHRRRITREDESDPPPGGALSPTERRDRCRSSVRRWRPS